MSPEWIEEEGDRCMNGHLRTEANTRHVVGIRRERKCRDCEREASARRRAAYSPVRRAAENDKRRIRDPRIGAGPRLAARTTDNRGAG